MRDRIVSLFANAFGRAYDETLWDHYYRDVPGGQVRAVSAWSGAELVGFGALLPQRAVMDGRAFSYGLYVGAMIHPEHRAGGVTYIELARRLRRAAAEAELDLIVAFPNESALLPLTRLAGFTPIDRARWVRGRLRDGGYADYLDAQGDAAFFDEEHRAWRLSRFAYDVAGGQVRKRFGGEVNLLDAFGPDFDFEGVFPYWESAGPCPHPPIEEGAIHLCALPVHDRADAGRLRRSVLLSDVY